MGMFIESSLLPAKMASRDGGNDLHDGKILALLEGQAPREDKRPLSLQRRGFSQAMNWAWAKSERPTLLQALNEDPGVQRESTD